FRDILFSVPWQESEPYSDKCEYLQRVTGFGRLPAWSADLREVQPLTWVPPCLGGSHLATVLHELQRLFALLTLSERKYVDPAAVITILLGGGQKNQRIGTQEDPTGRRRFRRYHASRTKRLLISI